MSIKKTEIHEAEIKAPDKLPVLPLRDLVVFPHMVVPLVIGREGTLAAVDDRMVGSLFGD